MSAGRMRRYLVTHAKVTKATKPTAMNPQTNTCVSLPRVCTQLTLIRQERFPLAALKPQPASRKPLRTTLGQCAGYRGRVRENSAVSMTNPRLLVAAVIGAVTVTFVVGPGEPAKAGGPTALRPSLQDVVGGLRNPVFVTASPGGRDERLYIVEQAGRIRIADGSSLLPRPFLDIRGKVRSAGLKECSRSPSIPVTSATTASS